MEEGHEAEGEGSEGKPTLHTAASPFYGSLLIKTLEENGIGRPPLYAATISTITSREYVIREGKAFKPTELGEVITKLMKERFPKDCQREIYSSGGG